MFYDTMRLLSAGTREAIKLGLAADHPSRFHYAFSASVISLEPLGKRVGLEAM